MRRLIAGNWKMNGLRAEATALASALRDAGPVGACDLLACPPATVLAMVLVVTWIGLTDFWRDRLSILLKVGLIGLSGLILWGAHLGGEQVYGHRVGVSTTQPQDNLPELKSLASLDTWAKIAPPAQAHVTMAGLAAAKRRGRQGGRPPMIDAEKIEAITAALDGGASKAAVCRNFGVARSTLIDTLARIGWTAPAKA